MRASPALTNLTAGEFTPLLAGRIDYSKYPNACRRLQNMHVYPHGPGTRRPGTYFVAEAKNSNEEVRLVSFRFSTTQAYVLEFGKQYIRFFKDHGQIVSGGAPYEIVSPYLEAHLFELKFTQSADVLYIVHPSYAPRKLTRTGHTAWTLTPIDFTDGPYLPDNDDKTLTITPSASTGDITLTASAGVFKAGHVGSRWRFRHNGVSKRKYFTGNNQTSDPVKLKNSFTVSLSAHATDGFNGKVTIQKSYDNQVTWIDWSSMTSTRTEEFFEDKDNVWYRAITKPDDYTVGSATLHIWQTDKWGVARITSVTSPTSAQATVEIELGSPFDSTVDKYSNGSIRDDVCADIAPWADADAVNGVSSQVAFDSKSCFSFDAGAAASGTFAQRHRDVSTIVLPNTLVVTLDVYFATLGTLAGNDHFQLDVEFADFKFSAAFAGEGLHVHDGSAWNLLGAWLTTGAWQRWTFEIERTGKTCNVYLGSNKQAGPVDCSYTGTFTDGKVILTQHGQTTNNQLCYVDRIRIGDGFGSSAGLATTEWREAAWNDERGYPHATTFFEDRLWYGGTNHQPQTVWASKVSDYENMVPGTQDDAALTFTLLSDQVNAILWMLPRQKLMIGAVDGEWTLSATNPQEAITPVNVKATREATHGSSLVSPIQIGNSVLFVQRAGRKLRELTYSLERDGYASPDLTRLAEHITRSGIRDLAWQQEPNSIIWATRNDGILTGLTYLRDEEVVGWHRHVTNGAFRSVAAIPAAEYDEVWVSVRRTIGGTSKLFIEYFAAEFDPEADQKDAFFVDCGLTYAGSTPVTQISGLEHMEGMEVQILADGSALDPQVVRSAKITLPWAALKVHAGLGYTSIVEPMPLVVGSSDGGSSQGKTKRIHGITVSVYRSYGFRIGETADRTRPVPWKKIADPAGNPPPLFTGDKEMDFDGDFSTSATIAIVQEQPLPLTVVAVYPRLYASDAA